MNQSLNSKLTRIDETLSIMKDNLRLDENEMIENLATATNLHSLTNIFIQEEEPEIKDGIWIQADKNTHPYEVLKIDEDIIIPGAWRKDKSYTAGIGITVSGDRQTMITLNGYLYSLKSNSIFKTNLQTGESVTWKSAISVYSGIYTDGVDIFTYGGTKVLHFKMDGTDTIYETGGQISCICKSPNWDYFYIVYDGSFYKYDMISKSRTKITVSISTSSYISYMHPLGEDRLLVFGNTTKWGMFNGIVDCIGNTYTSCLDSLDRIFANYFTASPSGDSLYFSISQDESEWSGKVITKGMFRIDLNTLTYEDLTSQFFTDEMSTSLINMVYNNGKFYSINTVNSNTIRITPQDSSTVQYDKNMIVIMQCPITKSEKQTALWTYPCLEGRMCQSFYDVYYYNKDTGFNFTLPTYYGNGTEWVKFKN